MFQIFEKLGEASREFPEIHLTLQSLLLLLSTTPAQKFLGHPVKLAFVLFILDEIQSKIVNVSKCCCARSYSNQNCSCKGFHNKDKVVCLSVSMIFGFCKVSSSLSCWKMRPNEFWKFWYPTDALQMLCFELEKWLERVDIMWQPCNSIPEASIWFIIDFGKFFCVKTEKTELNVNATFFRKRTALILSMKSKGQKYATGHSLNKEILKSIKPYKLNIPFKISGLFFQCCIAFCRPLCLLRCLKSSN